MSDEPTSIDVSHGALKLSLVFIIEDSRLFLKLARRFAHQWNMPQIRRRRTPEFNP